MEISLRGVLISKGGLRGWLVVFKNDSWLQRKEVVFILSVLFNRSKIFEQALLHHLFILEGKQLVQLVEVEVLPATYDQGIEKSVRVYFVGVWPKVFF